MSADHIPDASKMVAPVEAVAWRFWHEGGWNFSLTDPTPHLADCVERDALYTHPAPIKPSADSGELRAVLDEAANSFARIKDYVGGRNIDFASAFARADHGEKRARAAILDLIQSERAG